MQIDCTEQYNICDMKNELTRFFKTYGGFYNENNTAPYFKKVAFFRFLLTLLLSLYFSWLLTFTDIINGHYISIILFVIFIIIFFTLFRIVSLSKKNFILRIILYYLSLFLALFFSYIILNFLFIDEFKKTDSILFVIKLKNINNFYVLIKSNLIIKIIFSLVTILLFLYMNLFIFFNFFTEGSEVQIKLDRNKSLSEQIKIYSAIQHELGNKIPALANDLRDMSDYFLLKSTNEKRDLLLDVIRNPLPGEHINEIDTVKKLLDKMNNKISYSINIIDNLGAIITSDPSKFKPESVSLLEFLEKENSKKINENLNFIFKYNGEKDMLVKIDCNQFSILIQNLIANANRHGFTDNKKNYFILFKYYEDKRNTYIEVINNGNRMEKNYTIGNFIEAYNYIGTTGNSGIGGYLIGNIVSNHSGRISIEDLSEEDPEFKVCFKIILPKN